MKLFQATTTITMVSLNLHVSESHVLLNPREQDIEDFTVSETLSMVIIRFIKWIDVVFSS